MDNTDKKPDPQERVNYFKEKHRSALSRILDLEKEKDELETRLNQANEYLDINGMGVKF